MPNQIFNLDMEENMTKKDYRYFEMAKNEAALSDFKRTHLGCIAVYGNNIISEGHNTRKTHPMQMEYNEYRHLYDDTKIVHSLHAEMMCLNKVQNLINEGSVSPNKIKLYIYRIRKDIPHGISRPCPACMKRIKDLGIKQIYYTTDSGYAKEEIAN